MKAARVPIQKIGTVFQRPSWRYDAVRNPDKYGFRSLCTRQKNNAGAYKRMITKGVPFVVTYKMPHLFSSLLKELTPELAEQLTKVWEYNYRKNNKGKIRFQGVDDLDHFVSWNAAKVKGLNDAWLKKLINHVFNVEYCDEIQFALSFNMNKELSENKRYIGFDIFAGKDDKTIAKNWQMSPRRVEAIRMLFFDFSHFPKDKIAQWALLKQLAENGDILESEFNLYKRIYDMGELGLKAQLCHNHLTEDERSEVSNFLAKSAMQNTFNVQFNIRNAKDAVQYNRIMSDMAKLQLQREEIKLHQAELRLMELQISKLKKEVTADTDVTQPEDLKLLSEHIAALSFKDGEPKFGSVIDLHSK